MKHEIKQLKWQLWHMQNDQGIVGVPTGLTDLDEKLGGLHKSDLIILLEDLQWVKLL